MKKPTIISMIPINGEWVRQEDVPPDVLREIVTKVITQAAANVGLETTVSIKEETPEKSA